MPRTEVTMSSSYQITVPSKVREMLRLEPGDKLAFDVDGGKIAVERALSREEKVKRVFADLDEWREDLPEETKAKIEKYAGWTVNEHREYAAGLPETKAYLREKYGA